MKKIISVFSLLFSVFIFSQDFNLKGAVLEKETNIPLPGATIQIIGKDIGVVTDLDGNFELIISTGDKIKVSYLGMKTVELSVISSPIKVFMEMESNELDEVTVSVGYFDISKKDLSGSIAQITSDQLEKNRSGSVESILQGQVSGLVVSESSEPGGGSGVSIRGTNSILGGTQPLYVLDGIPVAPLSDAQGMGGSGVQQSSLNFINPNDIEKIEVLKEGMHSGISGSIPSSFRIIRQLLSRIEDESTGEILIGELKTNIPDHVLAETEKLISIIKEPLTFPVSFSTDDPVEAHLRTTWKPAMSVVGADGLPETKNAGNVLRPYTSLKLSIRIPPLVDQFRAQSAVKRVLTENPPYGARITVDFEEPASGWSAPPMASWLERAIEKASLSFYKNMPCSMGEGGTIPFMAMLGDRFPKAQFVITGVLGPESNAHGPNEFIHIPYVKKLTCCIVSILNDFPE